MSELQVLVLSLMKWALQGLFEVSSGTAQDCSNRAVHALMVSCRTYAERR